MSQPVKLSDALLLEARIAGKANERSIAGQVEFWAKLGKSVEMMMEGRQVLAMRRNLDAQPLSEVLASVNTLAGRKRLTNFLEAQPFPHFKQHPTRAGLLIRIDQDGAETAGRFVNRVFVPDAPKRSRSGKAVSDAVTAKTVRRLPPRENEKPQLRRKAKQA